MKKILAAFLLLTSLSAFATGETVVVTGPRIPGGGGGGFQVGGETAPGDPKYCKVKNCGKPEISEPTFPTCTARTVVVNKPSPLCGSFGETPAFLRADIQQIFLTCSGRAEYLWKETLIACKDPT